MIIIKELIPIFENYIANADDATRTWATKLLPLPKNAKLLSVSVNSKTRDCWMQLQIKKGDDYVDISPMSYGAKNNGVFWNINRYYFGSGMLRVVFWGPDITATDKYAIEILMEET